jgi:hypothetical protein
MDPVLNHITGVQFAVEAASQATAQEEARP